mgnify:CR=1 FL=1
MGLDIGTKTIGVAISDLLGLTAQGVGVIRRRDWGKDMEELRRMTAQYEVEKLLIGLPRRTTGAIGPEAKKIQAEGRKIGETLSLDVIYWDEWFSTASAEQVLLEADLSRQKRRQVIDRVAAAIILQSYLDSSAYREMDGQGKEDKDK